MLHPVTIKMILTLAVAVVVAMLFQAGAHWLLEKLLERRSLLSEVRAKTVTIVPTLAVGLITWYYLLEAVR